MTIVRQIVAKSSMQTNDTTENNNHIKPISLKKVNTVEIGIYPSQNADRMFDIIIHVQRHNLCVLNKYIKSYCQLLA